MTETAPKEKRIEGLAIQLYETSSANKNLSERALFNESQIKTIKREISIRYSTNRALGWFLFFSAAIVAFIGLNSIRVNNTIPGWSVLGSSVAVVILILVKSIQGRLKINQLKRTYRKLETMVSKKDYDKEKLDIEMVVAILNESKLAPKYKEYLKCKIYQHILNSIIADGHVSKIEFAIASNFIKTSELSKENVLIINKWAFNQAFLRVIADSELTKAEQILMSEIKEMLELSDGDVAVEMNTLETLLAVREITENGLAEIEVPFDLDKKEVCYHKTIGRIVKEKVVRSYQSNGVRYTDKELAVEKEGGVYLTNQRIIIVGEGVTSIKLSKIFNVTVNIENNLVDLDVDKRKTPIQITVPDSLIFTTKLNKALENGRN